MKSVLGGIVLMVAISLVAAVGLSTTFEQTAGEAFVSENGSVRLGN